MAQRSVLHVSAYDNQGGSARSAYRIHTGLRQRDIRSRMIVGQKVTDDPDVREIAENRIVCAGDWVYRKAQNLTALQYLMFPSSLLFLQDRWVRRSDIVQLYNIHGNYFAFTVLPALTFRKDVVWRLSDMWPMTGHCSYSHDCDRWLTGCGKCPYLGEYPDIRWDTTALLYRIKKAVYSCSHLTLVAPSRWMENLARRSPLLSRFPVEYIPNGIDSAFFYPMNKRVARERLGLSPDRPVVIMHDPGVGGERKGRLLLPEIVERLHSGSSPQVLVFGQGSNHWGLRTDIKALGTLSNADLREAFSASDLFVFPSLSENLPNIVLESMACGTPVVSFKTGGIVDAVENNATGVLLEDKSIPALVDGVEELLCQPERMAAFSAESRRVVERQFGLRGEIDKFERLYDEIRGDR